MARRTTSAIDRKLLASYLNDHLAGATAGRDLARRARGSNQGNRFGDFLDGLAAEIEQDRRTLEEVMDRLDIGSDRLKVYAGWVGEKVGRLKLNGRILGYSPLSRLVELEGLWIGVNGKLSLWQSLRSVADLDPVLDEFDFDALIAQAERQLEGIEDHRVDAAELALTGTDEVGAAPARTKSRAR
jgi:hypothetical protein